MEKTWLPNRHIPLHVRNFRTDRQYVHYRQIHITSDGQLGSGSGEEDRQRPHSGASGLRPVPTFSDLTLVE